MLTKFNLFLLEQNMNTNWDFLGLTRFVQYMASLSHCKFTGIFVMVANGSKKEEDNTLRNRQMCEMRSSTENLRMLPIGGGEGVSFKGLLLCYSANLFQQITVSPQDQQVPFPSPVQWRPMSTASSVHFPWQ